MANFVIFFIKIYQYTISPDKGIASIWLKGKICIHTPHCSKYSIQVLKRYGFYPGIIKVMERVSSCHPWNDNKYDPAYLKTVFFSSAEIGVPFLEKLNKDKRYEISAIITQPDRPYGRGQKINENVIKKTAKKLNIENILTPNKINPNTSQEGKDFVEKIKQINPDIFIVIAYGKIIPIQLLNIPHKGPINIHGSLLPKYRGASPIQSVFLNEEEKTGITLMKMDAKMDTGNIIKQISFDIKFNWTVQDIIEKFIEIGPKFVLDNIRKYSKKEIGDIKQDETKAIYCNKIIKEDGKIDIFNDSIENIYKKYRAYKLWPKIWFELNNKRFIIEYLQIDQNNFYLYKSLSILDNENLNKSILNIKIKPEGKKSISWKEFKNNYIN
ncbi:methionyl-tRNA formyltransferase [Candidatus Vampirococcus lugosii]|uniref:Methionyl-tRNA formyltransferase n=1 Tax=Candidatus Vampirococcus lugosii TaxID=2789015 RepID=A0ABS5QK37_9BACT|nr:methionyl-tRNA formyltransferase [Candidatus Vampirococcus lugosii]MBS8121622.1 methionyl-tRNA formyltransferase [Candidatus Vampirococcus lugosii]